MSDCKTVIYKTIALENKENLVDECASIKEFANNFIFQLNDNALSMLKNFIIENMITLTNDNILKNEDEKIFDYCSYINNKYKEILNLYAEKKSLITSKKKKKILDDIENILASQNNHYFEIYNKSSINPIFEEKMIIIKKHLDEFTNVYMENLDEYKKVINIEIDKNTLEEILNAEYKNNFFYDFVVNSVAEKVIPTVYNDFLITKLNCNNNINDLDNRGITTKYFELLKHEYDILSKFIKMHIIQLEEHGHKAKEEDLVIQEITKIIKDAHQYISSKVDKLSAFLLESENKDTIIVDEYDTFISNFKTYCDELFDNFHNEINFFINILEEKLQNIYEKFYEIIMLQINDDVVQETTRIIAELKAKFIDNEQMTKELLKAIKILIYYYKGSIEKLNNIDNYNIIKGVNETMQIKIESIDESLLEFILRKKSVIEQFNLEEVSFSFDEEDLKAVYKSLINIWDINKEDFSGMLQKITEDCLTIQNFIDKTNKLIITKKEKIEKYILTYKRINILSEIITFEEIDNYSISKIRDSNDIIVYDYVKIFDKVLMQINNLLKKHDITRITPKKHDLFDPKQHEILVAEVKDNFEKGQIIKTVTNGFKETEQIIIRANVIAAR